MATIQELESFKLSDAVKFHKELNPRLWQDNKLDPEVRDQLLLIAEDFVEYLGLSNLKVVDITISGSNAAYSYTPHSDLDLHILVDFSKLPDDPVYQELFTAKKTLYNDAHDITVRNVPVELYVQDTNQPVQSLGEYSILHDKWIRIPKKRRANFDQAATKLKYEKLGDLIELALKTKDPKRVADTIALVKRYRKSGLDKTGEFGPENLAYKAIRKQGLVQALYDLKAQLHAEKLSIEEYANEDYDPNGPPPGPEFKPTMPAGTVRVDVSDVYDWYKLGQHISNMKGLGKHDFGKGPPSTILSFGDEDTEHEYIQDLEKTGLTTTDIDPIDPNQPKGMKRQKTDPTFNVNETVEENQIVNVVSRLAADKIVKIMQAKKNAFLDLLAAGMDDKYKITMFGLKTKNLDVPNVRDPILKKLFDILNIRVSTYKDWKNEDDIKMHGAYYPNEYLIDLMLPALTFTSEMRGTALEREVASTLSHEIQHALDDFKSNGKALKNPITASDWQSNYQDYLKKPYEVNARFQQALMDIAEYIPMPKKDGTTTTNKDLPDLIRYAFEKNKLHEIYSKNQPEYKRLLSRAYKFFDAELNNPKQVNAIPQNIAKRALNWILGKSAQEIKEASGYIPSAKEKNDPVLELIYKARSRLGEDALYGGNCGMFALAIATKLKERGIPVTLGLVFNDSANLGEPTDIIDNEADLYHVVIEHNGNYYDGTGIVTPDTLLDIAYDQYGDPAPGWFTEANPFDKKIEQVIRSETNWNKSYASFYEVLSEASGYIPSEKEKNDPRFKTALTVDVKPDSIKKNAKAFNWKTSRAGIPPQARADGKLAEDLMKEWKSFLAEDQQELFPGYDEQHREKRLGNWLAKSWGVQNGKPQIFYHATTKDFDTFNTKGTGFASVLGMSYEVERHGSFFAVDPKFAEDFIEDPNTGRVKEGGRVLPVYLSIQYPIDLRDNALSRMLSDDETREEFKAHDIDLNSIYNHMYELDRWELFDGPEGGEFVENLKKLGFDGAIINESIPNNSNARSGEVWVAFSPNQVKSIHNRGSFSPDDPRLMKESNEPKIDAHRVGDTIWINYFEVPVKGKGLGRAEYEKFEKSLPKDIKKIRLVASDAGYGPTHDFWDRMGFDYAYPDDDNEMVKILKRG